MYQNLKLLIILIVFVLAYLLLKNVLKEADNFTILLYSFLSVLVLLLLDSVLYNYDINLFSCSDEVQENLSIGKQFKKATGTAKKPPTTTTPTTTTTTPITTTPTTTTPTTTTTTTTTTPTTTTPTTTTPTTTTPIPTPTVLTPLQDTVKKEVTTNMVNVGDYSSSADVCAMCISTCPMMSFDSSMYASVDKAYNTSSSTSTVIN